MLKTWGCTDWVFIPVLLCAFPRSELAVVPPFRRGGPGGVWAAASEIELDRSALARSD